jgi:hypothetical protein
MKSASELQPAYILNFGKQKLDIQTALYGDKAGKLIPNTWMEAKDFILFTYTENYDCPNCREKGTVKFFYSYYDKKSKQLYQLPVEGYPKDYWTNNSLENSIPLGGETWQINGASLSISYSKAQLENLMKHKNFSAIPVAQQEKTKALYNDLSEDELLVMILE